MYQKNYQKPLLVLGAMATLGTPLAADLSLIAYATTHASATSSLNQQTTHTELMAVQKNHTHYDLMTVTTQSLADVKLSTGLPGETLTESFTIQTKGSSMLHFNLSLAGPSDSQVTVKLNGKTYLNQTVGIGKLSEASFFALPTDEEIQVDIEYRVGNEPVVLPGQSWLELSQLVVTSQETPTRPLEYRVKGTSDWKAYQPEQGIETSIRHKDDQLALELRYSDSDYADDTYELDLTIQAPEAVAPLLVLESDGRFYLNHFNSVYNDYASVEVRFNHGEWQSYEAGMVLPFKGNDCLVEVKVVNDFGIETILPEQRYQLPTLQSAQISENLDGTLHLSHSNVSVLGATLEYQWNDGSWLPYQTDLTPVFESGMAHLKVRVVDRYGRISSIQTHEIQAPQPTGGTISFHQGLINIQAFENTPCSNLSSSIQTYYRVNGGSWKLYQKPFYLTTSDWSADSVLVEAKAVSNLGAESDVISLSLSSQDQEQIKPSISNVSYQGKLQTLLPVEFSAWIETNGGSEITLTEWSYDQEEWTPFERTFEVTFSEAGEHTIYLRATNATNQTSDVYSRTFNVKETVPPRLSNLRFEETDLYVGANFSPVYDVELEDGGEVVQAIWGGDIETMFETPGEKTITLKVQDSNRLWSEEVSYTFTVRALKAPVITGVQPSKDVFYEGDTISFDFMVDYDTQAEYQKVEWLAGYPFASHVGTHQIVFRVQDTQGQWSEPYTYTYQVKVRIVEPTLTFKNEVLKVPYGSKLTSIYKKDAIFTTGTASEAKYGAYMDTFDPKKVGKQTVKYLIKYTQNGTEHRKYVHRTIEVLPQDPTLSFKNSVLKVPYGSKLTSIYKQDVTLDKGSATNVKYAAYQSTFNPKKVGQQTVKYLMTYKQNGVEKRKYVYRTIEVTAVKPSLTFSKTTLTAKYGQTPNFNSGVTLDKGSATNVKYSVVKGTYNPKKRGKQTVSYQLSYTQNGKTYKTIVKRTVMVN